MLLLSDFLPAQKTYAGKIVPEKSHTEQRWNSCPDVIAKDMQWRLNSPEMTLGSPSVGKCWMSVTSSIENQRRSLNCRKRCRWKPTQLLTISDWKMCC